MCTLQTVYLYVQQSVVDIIVYFPPPLPKLNILSLNQKSTRMLNEQRTNETAGFRGKEDSRLEELSTGTHSALDSMGKLLLEQTLGSRLHYCFSTLIAEVLSGFDQQDVHNLY